MKATEPFGRWTGERRNGFSFPFFVKHGIRKHCFKDSSPETFFFFLKKGKAKKDIPHEEFRRIKEKTEWIRMLFFLLLIAFR